jgi:GNAT superfamily N-acetyltransferase
VVDPFSIEELQLPRAIGATGWEDFVEMTRVRNEIEAAAVGTSELDYPPEELLPGWIDAHAPRRLFLARVGGKIVGRGVYEYSPEPRDPIGWLSVDILPRFRRRGIGHAVLKAMETVAERDGRTTYQSGFISRSSTPGKRIYSPTGFGSVPAKDDGVRFALRHGFALEQVERLSSLALPVDPSVLAGHRAEAERAAGADYRVVRWEGRTPEDRRDDLATLRNRMATDAPYGQLEIREEKWTATRVSDQDDLEEQSPRILLTSAIEYAPTSRLVAFNELSVPPEVARPVAQRDTLVLSEHRGNRLGMLLKIDNIEALTGSHPGHPAITTANAEENRYMLSVNEAVGFVALAYESAWRKVL